MATTKQKGIVKRKIKLMRTDYAKPGESGRFDYLMTIPTHKLHKLFRAYFTGDEDPGYSVINDCDHDLLARKIINRENKYLALNKALPREAYEKINYYLVEGDREMKKKRAPASQLPSPQEQYEEQLAATGKKPAAGKKTFTKQDAEAAPPATGKKPVGKRAVETDEKPERGTRVPKEVKLLGVTDPNEVRPVREGTLMHQLVEAMVDGVTIDEAVDLLNKEGKPKTPGAIKAWFATMRKNLGYGVDTKMVSGVPTFVLVFPKGMKQVSVKEAKE